MERQNHFKTDAGCCVVIALWKDNYLIACVCVCVKVGVISWLGKAFLVYIEIICIIQLLDLIKIQFHNIPCILVILELTI